MLFERQLDIDGRRRRRPSRPRPRRCAVVARRRVFPAVAQADRVADVRRAVDPRRDRLRGEPPAELVREVVAVARELVVGRRRELREQRVDDVLDLVRGARGAPDDDLVDDDSSHRDMLATLEKQYDDLVEAEAEMATSDDLTDELEAFLRSQNDPDD